MDEKIFCCHGGLSPDLQSMEQIRRIMRPTDVPDTGQHHNILLSIPLFTWLLSAGLLCDLLWSDPDKDVAGWGENDRGVSFSEVPWARELTFFIYLPGEFHIRSWCRLKVPQQTRSGLDMQSSSGENWFSFLAMLSSSVQWCANSILKLVVIVIANRTKPLYFCIKDCTSAGSS